MSDKQQTAVQWLIEQIMGDKTSAWKDEIVQALNMEREQIEQAYKADLYPCSDDDAEQYFNDTYQTEQ